MSILSEDQAREVITTPISRSQIKAVLREESQLRVFTEELSEVELRQEKYWDALMEKMHSLSAKKFERVKEFARFPLPIVQISESVLNDFYRVFEGKNRFFNTEGDRDITRLLDWIRDNNPETWIEDRAKEVFKNKPNSFVVVDRDTQGQTYLVYIDSSRLLDAVFADSDGQLEYIAFIHSVEEITKVEGGEIIKRTFYGVYDDERYWVFYRDSDSDQIILVKNNLHGIGYCPARSFITTPSNSKNPFKRRVAFSSALSKMQDWSLFDIYRNYLDHYAPFPVTEAIRSKCANPECDNGFVATEVPDENNPGEQKIKYNKCEVCKGAEDGSLIYPGTHIGITLARDKEIDDGRGIFRMIFPETEALKYVPEKLEDIELEIRYKTVGINTMVDKEAINEMQVKGSFASMETVLIRNKTELENLYRWIVQTVGSIFYSDIELKIDANYGTEWYLLSEEDLQNRFKQAKAIGLPIEELLMIYSQLIETKYKGNNEKIERQKLLLRLDPLPLISVPEAINMLNQGLIDENTANLKINFLNFITTFELENGPITQFGIELDPSIRIQRILETLNIYNNENIASKQPRSSNQGIEPN